MTNYGLDLSKEKQDRQPEDWVFGAASQVCIAEIPEEERIKYLPKGEIQRGAEDTMDCVSRAFNNTLETKFNWLVRNEILSGANINWLDDNGYITPNGVEFSDAFIAILSGTTRNGNSMKAPVHAIHEHGLIPKSRLPLKPDMTFDEYHDPVRITEELKTLGKEFLKRFTINYEIVKEDRYDTALSENILNVAAFAWPSPVDGIYPRSDDSPNHAFIIFDGVWRIFDNYIDDVDMDFIKILAPDYNFLDYGYRVFIKENVVETVPKKKLNFVEFIINLIKIWQKKASSTPTTSQS